MLTTHINAELSLSSSNDGAEKEGDNEFIPVLKKARTSLPKDIA